MTNREQILVRADITQIPVEVPPESEFDNLAYSRAATHITALLKDSSVFGPHDVVAWVNIKSEDRNPESRHGHFQLFRFPDFPPTP